MKRMLSVYSKAVCCNRWICAVCRLKSLKCSRFCTSYSNRTTYCVPVIKIANECSKTILLRILTWIATCSVCASAWFFKNSIINDNLHEMQLQNLRIINYFMINQPGSSQIWKDLVFCGSALDKIFHIFCHRMTDNEDSTFCFHLVYLC